MPVVNSGGSQGERPRWQWIAIGAGFHVTLWLPLIAVSLPFGAVAVIAGYGVAAALAGALVQAFGAGTGPRDAAAAAAAGGILVWLMPVVLGRLPDLVPALAALVVLVTSGALLASFGAKFVAWRRGRGRPPR